MKKYKLVLIFTLSLFTSGLQSQTNSLWTKGNNDDGQLGLGYSAIPKSPINLNFGKSWKLLSFTQNGVMGIKNDGTLWAWGSQLYGELALSVSSSANPIQVGTDKNWANLYSNESGVNMIALKTDGSMWGWGNNSSGQLGLGHNNVVNLPTQIGSSNNWIKVFRNGSGIFCIKSDGTLWGWGNNSSGQLGLGNKNAVLIPTQIGTDNKWFDIQSNGFSTIGLKTNGSLWSWGINYDGQLGQGNTNQYLVPSQIGSDNNWTNCYSDGSAVFGIKSNGLLYSWGQNSSGRLGLNNATQAKFLTPQQVGADRNWKNIHVGDYSVYAIKTNGTIWSWGSNYSGQLGLGDYNLRQSPTQIGKDSNWAQFQIVNGKIVMVSKIDSSLWSWGYNYNGTLGLGNTVNCNSPQKIGNNYNWKLCYSSGKYSNKVYAIKSDGSLWGWGNLGNNQKLEIQFTEITNNINWKSVSTGAYYTIAVKNNGTLWSWGKNDSGQLGLGDRNERYKPTQIGTDSNWVDVKTGVGHALALKKDGTIWTWGANHLGQLGIGYKRDTIITIPVQIGSDNTWKVISCGSKTSFAVKNDGTLWGWGFGNQWSFSDFEKRSPFQIGTDIDWKFVSAGLDHILFSAIKIDNSLWMSYLDKKNKYSAPFQIGTDKDWNSTSAGAFKIYASKNDQTLWTCNADSLPVLIKCGSNKWNQFEASNSHCVGIQNDNKPYSISLNGTITSLDSNNDWSYISSRFYLDYMYKSHYVGIRKQLLNLKSNPNFNLNFYIRPNPTNNKLYLLRDIPEVIDYLIYTMDGTLVVTGQTYSEIDVSNLIPSIYFLKTNFGTFKFIKQ